MSSIKEKDSFEILYQQNLTYIISIRIMLNMYFLLHKDMNIRRTKWQSVYARMLIFTEQTTEK